MLFFVSEGNVHVYSNGRMRYTFQQRPERREQQRDVRDTSDVSPAVGVGLYRQR